MMDQKLPRSHIFWSQQILCALFLSLRHQKVEITTLTISKCVEIKCPKNSSTYYQFFVFPVFECWNYGKIIHLCPKNINTSILVQKVRKKKQINYALKNMVRCNWLSAHCRNYCFWTFLCSYWLGNFKKNFFKVKT